jgi:hypothetical protein
MVEATLYCVRLQKKNYLRRYIVAMPEQIRH